MTQHEKDLQAIAEYRMFDDTFMSAVFDGQIEETELLLRTVLGREDITVLSSESQFYLSNIYGKEVKLDILAKDSRDKAYHVEVQRDLSRAPVQRARFDAAMVDITLLKKARTTRTCQTAIRSLSRSRTSSTGDVPYITQRTLSVSLTSH